MTKQCCERDHDGNCDRRPPMADPTPAQRPRHIGWLACVVGGVMLLHLALLVAATQVWGESVRAALLGLGMVGVGLVIKVIDDGLWRLQQWLMK